MSHFKATDDTIKKRKFYIECKDRNGYSHDKEILYSIKQQENTVSNETVYAKIVEEYKNKGYEIATIYELFNGYSMRDLKEMAVKNPSKALHNMRIIYLYQRRKRK